MRSGAALCTRQEQETAGELSIAGAAQPPADCPLGEARAALLSGVQHAIKAQALSMAAAEGDWATRLLRLELALDAVRAGADPDDVDSTVLQLIDLSRTLDSTTELTRRVRAAVQLELAGAAAALAADVGIESLAAQALALARGAGPPLSSTRAVLFGTVEFRPDRADGPKIRGSREAPLIALPQGVAELSYLRFGDRSYWLLARGDRVVARLAPADAVTRGLALRWLDAVDQQADLDAVLALARIFHEVAMKWLSFVVAARKSSSWSY